jgi:hypothetical protein
MARQDMCPAYLDRGETHLLPCFAARSAGRTVAHGSYKTQPFLISEHFGDILSTAQNAVEMMATQKVLRQLSKHLSRFGSNARCVNPMPLAPPQLQCVTASTELAPLFSPCDNECAWANLVAVTSATPMPATSREWIRLPRCACGSRLERRSPILVLNCTRIKHLCLPRVAMYIILARPWRMLNKSSTRKVKRIITCLLLIRDHANRFIHLLERLL